MDLSLAALVVALVAVLVGSCIQGSLGFGLGLVAAPVLVIIDTTLVPSVVLGMGVPLTYLVAWRERAALDLRRVSWAIAGRVPGTVLGSVAVLALSERWLAGLFAVAILLAVAASVVGLGVEPTRRAMFVAGAGSGFMGTATSVGGPPMALLLQHEEGPELRASMAAFMAFGATISLAALVVVGEFDRHALIVTAVLVPAVLVGFGTSRWTNPVLDRGYTRPAVLVFAAASALSILVRDVIGLV
ncbi:MAG: sulfite exporter TauE/SafE family protein [Ilumatobacteraceae bacterium]